MYRSIGVFCVQSMSGEIEWRVRGLSSWRRQIQAMWNDFNCAIWGELRENIKEPIVAVFY